MKSKIVILFLFVVVLAKASDITFFDFQGQVLESSHNAMFMMLVDKDKADTTLLHASVRWITGEVKRTMSYRIRNNDVLYEGKSEEFDKDGNCKEIINYKDGKFHGERVIYAANNKRVGVLNYKNGLLDYKTSINEVLDSITPSDSLDVPAEFPGGDMAFIEFMKNNFHNAADLGSCIVVLQFIVNKNGHLSKIQCLKSTNDHSREAALKFANQMPNWTPARKNGQPVNSVYILPVIYKYDN